MSEQVPPTPDQQRAQDTMERSQKLVEALRQPQAYRHPADNVELLETHCAWVLLAGEFAYKIKKPVDFGFLDYSTLEKRLHFCQEEIRLNSRFAPHIYLNVVAVRGEAQHPYIDGEGPVLEYAVRMRRFPANGLLSQLAAAGRLESGHIDQMIEQVAAFHQATARAPADSPYGRPERVHHWVVENFHHIRPLVTAEQDRDQLERLQHWIEQQRSRLEALFEQRKREGFIRECHGDLHLGNLTLIDDKVTLFDCIEFNPELRWIDVMSEVAFLIMDLQERGYGAFANRFLNGYLQHTGDYAGSALLSYYQVYRAMVRAKVAVLRAQQAQAGAEVVRHAEREYHEYAALAEVYTAPRRPLLLITHGLSGSGKSTLARRLCESAGMIQIRSDIERKRLAGLAALERSGSALDAGLYGASQTEQTYARLAELADLALAAGYRVIVDATFLRRSHRQRFQDLATAREVPYVILDCQAADAELRRRIRTRGGADASEATLEVLDAQLASREALDSAERARAIRIDSAAPEHFAALLEALRRRALIDAD